MKRLLFATVLLAILVVIHPAQRPRDVDQTPESVRVERLALLARLWGRVKYFHPFLAYRKIDWDAALVEALGKASTAGSRAEYEAAVRGMLNHLGDPLTRVDNESQAADLPDRIHAGTLGYRMTDEGVLVVTVGDYGILWDQESAKRLKEIEAQIPISKSVVLDLRTNEMTGQYRSFQLKSSIGPIERYLIAEPLSTAGERSRIHRGFESSSAFSSGQYRSGLFVRNGKVITPAENARSIPTVFLVNKNSGILDSAVPLQAAGKGLIVYEGDFVTVSEHEPDRIDLGEGLSARVRLFETILVDGRNGDIRPDKIVKPSESGADDALETALSLARRFRPSKIKREKLPAFGTSANDRSYPDKAYPSVEYRLLAAFRIWNVIHYFYPYKDLMERDWDEVLREFIPKFEQAEDSLAYSLAVAEMMTHIHDSHAYVSGRVINEYFGTGYPPVRVRMIENRPVITHLYDAEAAKAAGAAVGDVVIRVDGEKASERLARYAKHLSASTQQSLADKAAFTFMNGKPGSELVLTVRRRDGAEKQVTLRRKLEDFNTLYHRERSGDIVRMLPGNIGYADLDRLRPEDVDKMLDTFKDTDAIIFDMRGYPNGTVWALIPRIARMYEVKGAYFETPVVGFNAAEGSSEAFYQVLYRSDANRIYEGKTVLLIDERTQSQAEHTGMFLRAANGTGFVGSPTAGANGEITTFAVPGGIGIGFTGQSVRFPDGRQLQRVGLIPDVLVKPTVEGIREGRDEVLDAAIRYLQSGSTFRDVRK